MLWFVGGDGAAAAGSPVGQQGHQVVDFGGGEWLEFRRATVGFGKRRHAKIGATGDDDAAQSLVADQRQEGGIVDRAAMFAAFAARSVAIWRRLRIYTRRRVRGCRRRIVDCRSLLVDRRVGLRRAQ